MHINIIAFVALIVAKMEESALSDAFRTAAALFGEKFLENVPSILPYAKPSLRRPTMNMASTTAECGRPTVAPAFTHDVPIENAVPHSWPWAVPVCFNDKVFGLICTVTWHGTIVGSRWILSVGFFTDASRIPYMRVRTGAHNVSDLDEAANRYHEVDALYECPQCANAFILSIKACPMLLKLKEEIEFGPHVAPVCLPTSETDDSNNLDSGAIHHRWSLYNIVEVDVMKQSNLTMRPSATEPNLFNATKRPDLYWSYGGNAVVQAKNGRWYQRGIAIHDEAENAEGTFLRVSQCCEWFEKVTGGEVKCVN